MKVAGLEWGNANYPSQTNCETGLFPTRKACTQQTRVRQCSLVWLISLVPSRG